MQNLGGQTKSIMVFSELAYLPLTRRFYGNQEPVIGSCGNLIGTPTEYNLGLIVLLSANQN